MSLLMQSSNLLLSHPRPLSPTTTNFRIMLNASSSSLLIMCPNHRSLASLIFPTVFSTRISYVFIPLLSTRRSISAFSSLSCSSILLPSFPQPSTLLRTITLILSHTYTFCTSVFLVFSCHGHSCYFSPFVTSCLYSLFHCCIHSSFSHQF